MSDRFNDAGEGKGSAPDAKWRITEAVEQAQQQEAAEKAQFVDRGIVNVKVSDLPQPEGINGPADFEKAPYEEMQAGMRKLELMKPSIADGTRADSAAWRQFDQEEGLSYPDGYQKVYDAFYGDDAVRVVKIGSHYEIDKGRHRIYLAKESFAREIPARVIERV